MPIPPGTIMESSSTLPTSISSGKEGSGSTLNESPPSIGDHASIGGSSAQWRQSAVDCAQRYDCVTVSPLEPTLR